MAEQIKVAELSIDNKKLLESLQQTKVSIDNLTQSQKELKNQGGENTKTFIQNEAQLKTLRGEYTNQIKVLQATMNATSALDSELKKEITSIDAAVANNKALKESRNQLNLTTDEGVAALDEINKKIDENDKLIKENVSTLEQQKQSIGDYKNQIKEAANELNPLNGGISGFIGRAKEAGGVGNLLTSSLKAITTGIYGMVKASLVFIATPIGAVVAAIGLALGLVVNYLKSTQEGMNKLNSVLTPIKVVFESLYGVLQDVGKALFDAFTNPKQALTDLSNFVKQNIINRFTAFGVILDGIINLDFKKIADGALQAATGVENVIDKVGDAAKRANDFIDEATKRGDKIEELTQRLSASEAEYIKQQGKLKEELKEQNLIAEDQTKTIAEREAAAAKSIEIAKELNAEQRKRLQLELDILKLKAQSNDTSDAEKAEIARKIAEISAANTQLLELETTQQNKLNTIRKEGSTKAAQIRQDEIQKTLSEADTQIQLYIEKNSRLAKTDEERLAFVKKVANDELAALKYKLDNKLLSESQYLLEKEKIENKVKDTEEANKQNELDRIKSFEDKKKELLDEIRLNAAEDELEREAIRIDLAYEKHLDDLEKMGLEEEEKTELLLLYQKQRDDARLLLAADYATRYEEQLKTHLDKVLEAEQTSAGFRAQVADELSNALLGTLGDTIAAQVAGIAIQALIESALVKINAAAASGKVTAAGAAASSAIVAKWASVPFGFIAAASEIAATVTPVTTASLAAIKIGSTNAVSGILKSAAIQAGGAILGGAVKGTKAFGSGGILEGPSHAQGGILTAFGELEGGEAIINKKSTAQYAPLLSVINQAGGGVKFANGGIVGSTKAPRIPKLIDYDELAISISKLPAPRVAVDEITTVSRQVSVIQTQASF